MAKALGAAVSVWYRLGRVEQAAEWAGLLTNFEQYLDPVLFNQTIYEQLERELGIECYTQAFQRGKMLRLENVISELAGKLTQTRVPD